MLSRMVGMLCVERTIAVDVLAMRSWYHREMSSTTDASLREKAENALTEAEAILGHQVDGACVGGDGFWSDLAERARKAIDQARKMPRVIAGKAASKIRKAAEAGLDKASEATADARDALRKIAGDARALVLTPVLLLLVGFIALNSSSLAGRARGTTQRYWTGQKRRGEKLLGGIAGRYGF
jgi:hypothetical protein